jgi:hypothetical protein
MHEARHRPIQCNPRYPAYCETGRPVLRRTCGLGLEQHLGSSAGRPDPGIPWPRKRSGLWRTCHEPIFCQPLIIEISQRYIEILKSEINDVDFFLSEKITPGENWRIDITKALKSAGCMLLLYLDPDQDWDWCLFEAGLFSAHRSRDGGTTALLYPISGIARPDLLSDIQTTSPTLDSMKTFLASFYNTTKQTDPKTWTNLDATALRLVGLSENNKPKRHDVTYLRPSLLLYPAWFPAGRPDWRRSRCQKLFLWIDRKSKSKISYPSFSLGSMRIPRE